MTWSSAVGYRQSTRAGAGDHRFQDAGTIIAIGHDPNLIGSTHNVDIGVVGNVKHAVGRAERALEAGPRQPGPYPEAQAGPGRRRRRRGRPGWWSGRRSSPASKPIHPDFLGYTMGKSLAENTMLVSEAFRAADQLMPLGYA